METIENQHSKIENLRPLVEAETGMDFSGGRFTRLVDAVERVAVKHDLQPELDSILGDPDQRGPFLEHLTAELTVGESFFLRNEHHFKALREEVLPDILQRNAERREIRIWSAGCAGGEEPYSLAILIDQLSENQSSPAKKGTGPICRNGTPGAEHKLDPSPFSHHDWTISILGTDINTEFLRRARDAVYRPWSFRRTNIQEDMRYFEAEGEQFHLRPHVREGVRFHYLNLVKDIYPSPLTGTVGLDLILFRNVAIYLQAEVVEAILQRFYQCLHPGGWLLLGEAEVSHMQPGQFEVRRFGSATFFRRPSLEDAGAAEPPRSVLPVVPDTSDFLKSGVVPAPARVSPLPQVVASARSPLAPPASPLVNRSIQPRVGATPDAQPFDWQQVERCLLREDFAAAEKELDSIRDRGARARTMANYARRLLDLSQVARARKMLDACLELEPLMIDAHLLKAGLAEERGELGEAESACRRALYLDRDCAMAHLHLAMIQQQSGNRMEAEKSLRLVQKLAKSHDANALVQHGDGICYGRLSQLARSMMES